MKALASDEDRSLGERGKMLRLAVAVLVRDVRGADRDADREERQQRRDQVGSGVQRLGDQSEAVRRQAGAELERDEHDGRDHRDERRSPLRMHPASKTEEPAEAGPSSIFVPKSYELAMSPWKLSLSVVPEPFPRSCQWRTISRGRFPLRFGAV